MEIDAEALRLLSSFSWPGNVRELSNTIERAVVLAHGPVVSEADLPDSIGRRSDRMGSNPSQEQADFDETLTLAQSIEALKISRVKSTLAETEGNQTKAAQILGLPQSNLSRLMKTLGLR